MSWTHDVFLPVLLVLGIHFAERTFAENVPNPFRKGTFYPTKGKPNNKLLSESLSSGSIRDVIRRGSARFQKVIVRNANNEIVFLNEDCRMMTSRAKSRVDILSNLVKSYLGSNAKLHVLEAWTDSVDSNNLHSLHYEGRAFKMKLSDGYDSKLGQLGTNAVKAGFNWVYYDPSGQHIYASVIPDVCQSKVDLIFVVDTSGSVGWHNFLRVQTFLKNLVDFFTIGKDETRVGLVNYSNKVIREFALNKYYDKNSVKKGIDDMKYQASNTATGDALDVMLRWGFNERNGMRPEKSIPKIGILVTDGYSNDGKDTWRVMADVRRSPYGINMVAIGVTKYVYMDEIRQIASKPFEDHYVAIDQFKEMTKFVDRIGSISCDEGALIAAKCSKTSTKVEGGSFKYFKIDLPGTKKATIEVEDIKGECALFTSLTNKNPGPLSDEKTDKTLKKNFDDSPRAETVDFSQSADNIVFVAVQGLKFSNEFQLSLWEALFDEDTVTVAKPILEGVSPGLDVVTVTVNSKASTAKFVYSIAHGDDDKHFKIDASGKIQTNALLDRERKAKYSLVIVAQDDEQECHKGRTQVVVNVGDKNDNPPVFKISTYDVTIREDTTIGTSIAKVEATDLDDGQNAEISFSISGGTGQGKFNVDVNTGVVTVSAKLDYFDQKDHKYTLTLLATDRGNPSLDGSSSMNVHISFVNRPPVFTVICLQNGVCSMIITENSAIGTKVGFTINAKDTDTDNGICDAVKYRITSNDRQYFAIGERTGVMTNIKNIDRELKSSYQLTIEARDCASPPLVSYATVMISALDENDNAPRFSAQEYRYLAPEDLAVTRSLLNVYASDLDLGKNAVISFSVPLNSVVSIDSKTGLVYLAKALDRETAASHQITVTATDGKFSSQAKIHLIVTDVNDNKPEFQGSTHFTVNENSDSGTVVGTIRVTDHDEGLNARIRFEVMPYSGSKLPFKLDLYSGELTVQANIDRERKNNYTFGVRATDLGNPPLSNTKQVVVTISDVNDNAPKWKKAYSVLIKESHPVDSSVIEVKATDEDSGDNGKISYSIGGMNDGTFVIDKVTGQVTLAKKLSFGQKSFYSVTLIAQDATADSISGRNIIVINNLNVRVQDVNDFAPSFVGSPFTSSIDENVAVGTSVTTIVAKDDDSGPSGQIHFSFTNGSADFVIDNNSGNISTAGVIDFEQNTKYIYGVMIRDLGVDRKSAETTVTIKVNDLNDNSPKLVGPFTFTILETSPRGASIGQLSATDEDSGANAAWTIEKVTSSDVPEVSVSTSGAVTVSSKLTTATAFDRETKDEYRLEVMVSDPAHKDADRATVVITIGDKNDNSPKFEKSAYVCDVTENQVAPTSVCDVKATDSDAGVNAEISYLQPRFIPFYINSKTGLIETSSMLDRESNSSYSFEIKATDPDPNHSDTTKVIVNVIDVNDNAPKFAKDSYTVHFTEEKTTGTGVFMFDSTVSDKDADLNGKFSISIESGHIIIKNTCFFMDGLTMKSSIKLDRETTSRYDLVLKATDRGTPPLTSSVSMAIIIGDINDNKPLFLKKSWTVQISESAGIGSFVVQVIAEDKDEGVNAQITYSIIEVGLPFTIDGSTGRINTNTNLDYETTTEYNITVQSEDGSLSNPKTDTATVSIQIINEDDNAPEFGTLKEANIYENVALKSNVIKFNATDKDGGILKFKILSGNDDGLFAINDATGLVTVAKAIDRESRDFHNLTVSVTDANGASTSTNLPVNVLDRNDNRPVILSPAQMTINENMASQSLVYQVTATDRDIGVNQEVVFSLEGEHQSFNIDTQIVKGGCTGKITTTTVLDRERKSSYDLVLIAEDRGTPAQRTEKKFTVNVGDANDNSPVFEQDEYSVSLMENVLSDSILTLKATDKDLSENARITYTLLDNPGNLLKIGANDGQLSNLIRLDREMLVGNEFTIRVKATDAGSPSRTATTKVTITVLDENDNSPVIRWHSVIPLNESSSTGLVATVDASDKDQGANAKLTYELVSGNDEGKFKLHPTNGTISLVLALDYETTKYYGLNVRVTDNGLIKKLQSHRQFSIAVLDDNDNKPRFYKDKYTTTIREGVQTTATSLLNVTATDADTLPVNTQISYSISANRLFLIDSKTGNLQTVAGTTIDYETAQTHTLVVTAKDWKYQETTTVEVQVININDNVPVFSPSKYEKTVPEDQPIGSEIIQVSATDADNIGPIQYRIERVYFSDVKSFSIDQITGTISLIDFLDREKNDRHVIEVIAKDNAIDTDPKVNENSINVTIHVSDVNDNRPVFSKTNADIFVSENLVGHQIFSTRGLVSDADLGRNGEMVFNASGISSEFFHFDASSGNLTTLKQLDREMEDDYQIEIISIDRGISPLISIPPLILNVGVLDKNDNAPQWSNLEPNVTINEAVPKNSLISVLNLRATDRDIGTNAVIVYSIKAGNNPVGDGDAFSFSRETGVLSTLKVLDRETLDQYNLTLTACDQGAPSLCSDVVLQIEISDANDNHPDIDTDSIHMSIDENKESGSVVGTVIATDLDIGKNKKLVFSLELNDLFAIDPSSGVVTTLAPLDREERDRHTIKLFVADSGSPSLVNQTVLNITVNDVDDNCPVFERDEFEMTLSEDLPIGESLLTIRATDADTGVNAQLDYAIVSGHLENAFKIDELTGVLSVGSGRIDHEVTSLYELNIRASRGQCLTGGGGGGGESGGDSKNITYAHVRVKVIDVNDNAPEFDEQDKRIENIWNMKRSELVELSVTDKDSGDGGKVDVQIANVQVVNIKERVVTIMAKDRGIPPLNSTMRVAIETGFECETITFSVSNTNKLMMTSLCSFAKVEDVATFIGANTTLKCTALSNMNASAIKYRWVKNGVIQSADWSTSSELRLWQLTHNEDGTYACQASSEHVTGQIQSAPVMLEVREAPVILLQPVDAYVEEGNELRLRVEVRGKPTPEFQWYRDDVPVPGNLNGTKSEYLLSITKSYDQARYHVIAKNGREQLERRVTSTNAAVKLLPLGSVVRLSIEVRTARMNGMCHRFMVDEFADAMTRGIGKQVRVTNIGKTQSNAHFCPLTACTRTPCQNAGLCNEKKDANAGDIHCTCPPSWSGKRCEIDVDECTDVDACENGGTCTNEEGTFTCACASMYSGKRCEFRRETCAGACDEETHVCVPSVIHNSTCLLKSSTVYVKQSSAMTEQQKYDLEAKLTTLVGSIRATSKRKRRDVPAPTDSGEVAVPFGLCKAHLLDTSGTLPLALDCSRLTVGGTKTTRKISSSDIAAICTLLLNEGAVQSCGENRTQMNKLEEVIPASADVRVVVTDNQDEAMSAEEALNLLNRESDALAETLSAKRISVTSFKQAYPAKGEKEKSGSNKGAITGAVIAIVALGAIAIAVVLYRRRQAKVAGRKKQLANNVASRSVAHRVASKKKSDQQDLVGKVGVPNPSYEVEQRNRDSTAINTDDTIMFEMPKGLARAASKKNSNTIT